MISARKSNVYDYENKADDKQKIHSDFKSATQNTSERQQDKLYRFCLWEEEGI